MCQNILISRRLLLQKFEEKALALTVEVHENKVEPIQEKENEETLPLTKENNPETVQERENEETLPLTKEYNVKPVQESEEALPRTKEKEEDHVTRLTQDREGPAGPVCGRPGEGRQV